MTRHDGEPDPDPTIGPVDGPPPRSDATDTAGTWAFISPFAASPGSYVPSSATPDQAPSNPDDQPNPPGAGPAPTATFGRPDWGPAGQPGWEQTATGAVGGGAWQPGAAPNEPPHQPPAGGAPGGPNQPPTWGAPAGPNQAPTWGAPAVPNQAPTWGAPAMSDPAGQPPSRWKTWQKVTAGGVLAGVIVIGGVAAVSAANASSNSSTTQAGSATGGPGFGGGEFGGGESGRAGGSGTRGGLAGAMALANALHGDFVVSSGGGTQTMRLQNGELTSVAADSITVKSTDGYTLTYAIGSGVDVSGLTQGETVRVIGTVDGDTATATAVTSGTTGSAGGFGGGPGWGQFGQGGSGQGQGGSGMQPPEGMTPPNGGNQAPQTS